MRTVQDLPEIHFFVCANRRDPSSPLGPGCGDAGRQVYDALKSEVARRRAFRSLWVTQTRCLGICPARGATVAVYPEQAILTEVEAADVPQIVARSVGRA